MQTQPRKLQKARETVRPSVRVIATAGLAICVLMLNRRPDHKTTGPEIFVAPASPDLQKSLTPDGSFSKMADVDFQSEIEDEAFTPAELSAIQEMIDNRATWMDGGIF